MREKNTHNKILLRTTCKRAKPLPAKIKIRAKKKIPKKPLHNKKMCILQIWNGGDPPTIDDELYLSIVQEIKEAEEDAEGVQMGDPWTIKIPTNLVMLQQEIPPVLPDFSDDLLTP